jgi:hypothetical protein
MNKWVNIILIALFLTAFISAISIVCGVIIRESINANPIYTPICLALIFWATVAMINQVYNKFKSK